VQGVVLTGGNAPDARRLQKWLKQEYTVVAADSGLDHAKRLGIEPSIILGDMDSLSDRSLLHAYPGAEVYSFDAAKDETDTEIAIRTLYERGVTDILLAGGGGGRLDHLFGIYSLFHREMHPTVWLTDHSDIICIENRLEREFPVGSVLSFFPAGRKPCRMHTSGLRWPLDALVWEIGDAGISNVVDKSPVVVEMYQGRLLLVRDH